MGCLREFVQDSDMVNVKCSVCIASGILFSPKKFFLNANWSYFLSHDFFFINRRLTQELNFSQSIHHCSIKRDA